MAAERGPEPPEGSSNDVARLQGLAGRAVRIRLADGSTWAGELRTDLLTERSVSVFLLGRDGEEGVTLYIHQIVEIVALPISAE